MLDARPPHFIQGYHPSLSSELLKIPSKFAKHMEGKTSGTVSLVGPSGNTWHADLIMQNDGLFIYEGWAAFVRDHFLENGDSLVFRYDGNLHFTVQIFDQSSCEKETAFSAECHQGLNYFDKHFGKRKERECTTLFNSIVDGVPKKTRSGTVQSECIAKYPEASEMVDKQGWLREDVGSVSERCEAADFLNGSEFCGSPLKNSFPISVPSKMRVDNENSEATTNHRITKEVELGPRDCMDMLSASEAERIAQSFTSNFPYFTQVMKRFNISGSYTLKLLLVAELLGVVSAELSFVLFLPGLP